MSEKAAALDRKKLTTEELIALKRCEASIETAMKNAQNAWLAAGAALKEVSERRLWRDGWDSFDAYCEERWGVKRRRAFQLIEAFGVVESLPVQHVALVGNSRQAAALAAVPEEEREEVLDRAQENGKPLTAAAITRAAKETVTHELCKTGAIIPEPILAEWHRAEEFGEQLRKLSEVKCFVDDALKASDPIFAEIRNTVVAELLNVYGALRCVIPYAVCPWCSGHKPNRCTPCKGRGFLSKFSWDTHVPEEIKRMRMMKK